MPESFNWTEPPKEYDPDYFRKVVQALERQCRTSVDTVLGRSTAGGRTLEEITVTAAARSILDDATVAAIRTTLGLGTASVEAYTEGVFTPGLSFGGGTTGITYAEQSGAYVKVGRLVVVQARVTLSNKGSSTGTVLVTGLPFTVWNNAAGFSIFAALGSNLSGLTSQVLGAAVLNTTTANLYDTGATGVTTLDDTNFTNTSDMLLTVPYRTA